MKQDEELNNKIIERMIDALNDMLRLAVQYPDYSDYEPHYKPCRYFVGAPFRGVIHPANIPLPEYQNEKG